MIFQTKLTTKDLEKLAQKEVARRFHLPIQDHMIDTFDSIKTKVVKDGIEVTVFAAPIK